jgi:hypothetical protein
LYDLLGTLSSLLSQRVKQEKSLVKQAVKPPDGNGSDEGNGNSTEQLQDRPAGIAPCGEKGVGRAHAGVGDEHLLP